MYFHFKAMCRFESELQLVSEPEDLVFPGILCGSQATLLLSKFI